MSLRATWWLAFVLALLAIAVNWHASSPAFTLLSLFIAIALLGHALYTRK